MKFIKNTLKTIFKALFSACIVNLIFLFLILFSLRSIVSMLMEPMAVPVEDNSVLIIDSSTQLSDIALGGRMDIVVPDNAKLSLMEIYKRIDEAGRDSRIKSIYIYNSKSAYSFNLSQTLGIKRALQDFKKSGKKVSIYLSSPTISTGEYFLASEADEIWINPQSCIDFSGIAFQGVFFGKAFDKYGIRANIVKCGANKSFGDMFTRSDFAPQNKKDLEDIARGIDTYLNDSIAQSMQISPEALVEIRSENPILSASKAKELRLVTKLLYKDQASANLGSKAKDFKSINITDYVPNYNLNKKAYKNNIALVYMTGSIVEYGNQDGVISSSKYCKILADLRDNNSVKAVVLVINSGGGSAYASEEIRREVELLSEKKKTIAYVTSMCASGAYWISSACDEIYAQETSLIGSIGVFSIIFDVEKLAGDFGITFDTAKASDYADIFSSVREPSKEELAIMQSQVDIIYDDFVNLVSKSRDIDIEVVKSDIATGSVWTSGKAKEMGLIDSADSNLPYLMRDLAKNLNMAGDYGVLTYPRPKTLGEFFMEILEGESSFSVSAEYFVPKKIKEEVDVEAFISTFEDRRHIYLRSPLFLKEF